jgi:hypothetical protein
MKNETTEALTACHQILATAEQDGAHVLFGTQMLSQLGRLRGSDDYLDDAVWPKIKALEDEIEDFFEVRETSLKMDRLTMLRCLLTLSYEFHQRDKANAKTT